MLHFIIEAANNNILYIILFVIFIFCLYKVSDILDIDVKATQRYIFDQFFLNPLHYFKKTLQHFLNFLHDILFFRRNSTKKNHKHKINLLKKDYINYILANNNLSEAEAAEILAVDHDSDKETVMEAFRQKLEEINKDPNLNYQQKVKKVQIILEAKYKILGS